MRNLMKNIVKIGIFIIILFFSCGIVREKEDKIKKRFPDMVQIEYEHYIYKIGRKFLIAKIKQANFFEKANKIECDVIRAEIYNSKNELTTLIEADKGIINKDDKVVYFSGNVKIQSFEQKTKLYTEELRVDYQNNRLISDKDIIIEKDDGSYLKSKYFESNLKLQETRFDNLESKYFYNDKDNTNDKKK